MAPTKGRGRKPAQNETAKALSEALALLSIVKPDPVLPQSEYVFINNGVAVAHNGTLTIGMRVDAGFNGYAHMALLKEAMGHVGKQLTLTVVDPNSLSVSSGDYHSIVPLMDPGRVIPTPPDQNVYAINKQVKEALITASKLTRDTAETVMEASVLMNGPTVVGTNRAMLIEAWHGFQLPTRLPLPKVFVTALDKAGSDPVGFGMGQETITVHLENGNWIRTRFYSEGWPSIDTDTLFTSAKSPTDIPKGLAAAVRKVQPFAVDDCILFTEGAVQTHLDPDLGARVVVKDLFDNGAWKGKLLNTFFDMAETFTVVDGPRIIGYTQTARAVISGMDPDHLPEGVKATAWINENPPAQSPQAAPEQANAPAWGDGRAQYEMDQMAQGEPDTGPFVPPVTDTTQTAPVNAGTPHTTAPEAMPGNTDDAWNTGQSAQASASPSNDYAVANVPLDQGQGGGTYTENAPSAEPNQTAHVPPRENTQSGQTASPFEPAPWTE